MSIEGLSDHALSQIKSELEFNKKVDHPSIIKFHSAHISDDSLHIVMELCMGTDVFTRLKKNGAFNEFDAACIIKQLVRGVRYLHSKNIIHRDIKPENVMFLNNEFLTIKLIDFGLAKTFGQRGLSSVIGTPHYMAPEVVTKSYDSRADVWSIGVMLYMLLAR